ILEQRRNLDVIEIVNAWAESKEPKVAVELPRGVSEFFVDNAHPMLINSILNNLYANSKMAIEQCEAEGRIWIVCSVVGSEMNNYIDVLFRDSGRGIQYPPDEWPK